MANNNVRFVRVKGRIVPIRNKGIEVDANVLAHGAAIGGAAGLTTVLATQHPKEVKRIYGGFKFLAKEIGAGAMKAGKRGGMGLIRSLRSMGRKPLGAGLLAGTAVGAAAAYSKSRK